jgi:hypothetical protein
MMIGQCLTFISTHLQKSPAIYDHPLDQSRRATVSVDSHWFNLPPNTPVRGVAQAAQRRAWLEDASTPEVPFGAFLRRPAAVILSRRSVLGEVRDRRFGTR